MKYPISTLSKALNVKQFFRASEWYFLSVLSLYTVLALLFFSEIPIVKTILLEIEKLPAKQPVKWVLDVDPVEVG